MANTFTMIGPSGVYPGQAQPKFPQFTSVGPANNPPPSDGTGNAAPYTPIQPLPGALGPSSTPL